MKKMIALALCAILVLSLFACGKKVEVDYENTEFQDWMYQPETEDETTKKLIAIDTCQYGTAGASLKQMRVTVELFWLCIAEDREEKLDAYLEAMTDTQRDYFSFQWQNRVGYARKAKASADFATGLLGDIGLKDVTLDFFNLEDVEAFDKVVMEKLKDHGVADEWRNHLEETPFIHWDRDL